MTDHADLATITLWFYGVYALLRIVLWRLRYPMALWVPLTAIGAGGLVLIYLSSTLGARMVFEQGVGVAKVATLEAELVAQARELAQLRGGAATPTIEANGSWSWVPGLYAQEAFEQSFDIHEGAVAASMGQDDVSGQIHLALMPMLSPVVAVLDSPIGSVEFDITLDASDFKGLVRVVHHVQATHIYHFTELAEGKMRLGQLADGEEKIVDEQPFVSSGMTNLRVVADRTHFRTYADGVLIAHGHSSAPSPGPVGIMLDGTGTLRLGPMRATAIR